MASATAPESATSVQFKPLAGDTASTPTLPRSGHCLSTLPGWHDDDAIMFGGYVEQSPQRRYATNELWTFSLAQNRWKQVTATGKPPQGRLVAQAVVVGDGLWVIGGWDPGFRQDGGSILSDIWRLDLRTYTWQEIKPQGEQLEPISRFQAAAVGPKIYIHTHRSIEDILVLDTSPWGTTGAATLAKEPVRGLYPDDISPPSRGLHSMTAVGNSLYVFGGAPSRGPMMDDLWRLDLETMTWRQLHPSGPKPHARCSHVAAAVGDHILYFGGAFYGQNGALVMSDNLFYLDIARNTWVFPLVKGTPAARNASAVCHVSGGLLLHGGWKAFVETFNDTYLLTHGGRARAEAPQGVGTVAP